MARMGERWTVGIVCTLICLGCTPEMLGQDDGFHARIPAACKTLETCLLLRDEAQQRILDCQPNTIGSVRCGDARDDAADVDRRIQRLQAKRAEAQAKADLAAEERREKEEELEVADRNRRMWLDDAVSSCARTANDQPCRSANAGRYDEATRGACLDRCKLVIEQSLQSEYARALDDCTSQSIASSAPVAPDCHFQIADPALEARRVECAAACKDQAEKLAALRPPPAPTPAAPAARVTVSRPVPQAAPPSRRTDQASGGGGGGTGLLCCDGSLSPTCACPGHQGCCSHHGGVCGCQ
jgi:hypothetical protein